MMGYHGGKLTDFFSEGAHTATVTALRDMADRGASRMKEVAAMNTPVRTGRARAGWEQTPVNKTHVGGSPAYRSSVLNHVHYIIDLEHGTGLWGPKHAKYLIVPKKPGGMLHWIGKDGQHHFARKVMHPGSPGHHMMAIAANVVQHETGHGLMSSIVAKWAAEVTAAAQGHGFAL